MEKTFETRRDKDGRLVAGARSDFERSFLPLQLEALRHQGHDIRLGDRLPLPDRKGIILIGRAADGRRDEQMPGHGRHGLEDPPVGDVAGPELRIHHVAAEPGEAGFVLLPKAERKRRDRRDRDSESRAAPRGSSHDPILRPDRSEFKTRGSDRNSGDSIRNSRIQDRGT